MRCVAVIGALLLVMASILAADGGVRADTVASPVASPAAMDCPITQPNGNQPPTDANVFSLGSGDYGNDVLWTSLWIWGTERVYVPDELVNQDGSVGPMKWSWYRYVAGDLIIEGRRLDAPAPPLVGEVPDGYGEQGFTPSGIHFPTTGCWEVTGRVGDGSLTFVVLVVLLSSVATPEATP